MTTRRELLAGALALLALPGVAPARRREAPVPRRRFGRAPDQVSILGLGGWHLGAARDDRTATRLVHEALDAGIDFLDNAWEYHRGRSEERMGRALRGRRERVFLMTKTCTHGRGARVALEQLEESLRRLRTDHLDLWQIHEVVDPSEPERYFAPGGAVEALARAKREGKTRYVGFTGHRDPALHRRMLDGGFEWDAVQLPLNPFDASFRSFEREVLPELGRRGIAAIGMKSLGGGLLPGSGAVTAEEALRYAMSLPVATTLTGVESPELLRLNLAVARGFAPLPEAQMRSLRERCAPAAATGEHEGYKTGTRFDGGVGRRLRAGDGGG